MECLTVWMCMECLAVWMCLECLAVWMWNIQRALSCGCGCGYLSFVYIKKKIHYLESLMGPEGGQEKCGCMMWRSGWEWQVMRNARSWQ